ncbi:retrovirus-related pol polyprotein from transposon TNT 1-94 [Tanacetum coccineum]
MKNKVEVQLRRANSSSNKKNHVKDRIYDANVKHTMLNANSELIYVKCKQCMFDANHDVCFLDFVNDVNVNSKSKSAKQSQHHNIWKPTVPHKETTSHSVETQKPEIKVYSRRLKQVKSIDVSSSSSLVNDSKFVGTIRFGIDQIAKIMGYGDYQLGDLFHLNFGTLNKLAKDGLARGIPKLKFKKDHLCLTCAIGKSKKSSHQPKAKDTNQEKLYLLHMDLCGPMHVESINRKRTDNGTELVYQTLREFYENVSISHQTSVARTPQQNGVVERRNWTLVEVARTLLILSKALLFMWAEAINTACYTQNRSLIRLRYNKTPYQLMHNKKPDLSFLYVFRSLCYLTNDGEDLGKLNAKANIADNNGIETIQSDPGPSMYDSSTFTVQDSST